MNLNDAFRYQNAITQMFEKAAQLICYDWNILKTVQVHNRKAVNPEAEDETVEVVNERASVIPADDLIQFMCRMIEEKEKLATAIARAKAALDFNFDAECALNGNRRKLANQLKSLNAMEGKTRRVRGSGFKFNANGEQVQYTYDVDETTTVTFDKEKVRTAMKKFAEQADAISRKIDMAEVNTEVDYACPFDINDSFEDAVRDVLSKG